MTELSDDLLVAYVDGQLARDQSRAVKRVLDQDHIAAHRAESLRLAHDRLEWVLESLLDDERALLMGDLNPPPLSPPPRPSLRARITQWGTATIVTAGVAIGLSGLVAGYAIWGDMGGQSAPEVLADPMIVGAIPSAPSAEEQGVDIIAAPAAPVARAEPKTTAAISPAPAKPLPASSPSVVAASESPSWQEEVMRLQALISRESLEIGLESQANLEFVRFQLAKAIGADLVVPDLSGEGLKFARAQILRHRGEPFAHLSYLPATGEPVALFAKSDGGDAEGLADPVVEGLTVVSWTGHGVGYVMAGRLNKDDIQRVAFSAREQTVGTPEPVVEKTAPDPF